MSRGALSNPSLIGSTFAQTEAQNLNQRHSMKKEAPCFMNRKCTPETQGAQTPLMKKETSCFMNQKRTTKMEVAQRPPIEKEAPRFMNQKFTSKNTNTRASKFSNTPSARGFTKTQKIITKHSKVTHHIESLEGDISHQIAQR
jgi:hypothetical protein